MLEIKVERGTPSVKGEGAEHTELWCQNSNPGFANLPAGQLAQVSSPIYFISSF